MKVTINGSGVSPEGVCGVLSNIEDEYGIKIKDLTLYIRFVNSDGKFTDPRLPANATELVVTIEHPNEDKPLEYKQFLNMVEKKLGNKVTGDGLKILASVTAGLQITKNEAEEILNSFEDRPTIRAIEKKAFQIARNRKT